MATVLGAVQEPDQLVERLKLLDSCLISDALDRREISGVAVGLRALTLGRRLVGRCRTVLLAPVDLCSPAGTRHLGAEAIARSACGDVIIVDNGGRTDSAAWGGLLAQAAAAKDIAGVVVDGACRDIDAVTEANLPVYGLAAVPVSARGRVCEVATGSVVRVRGIWVQDGDYVIADLSGVAFLPAAQAWSIVAAAEYIAACEREFAAALRAGRSPLSVLDERYEHLVMHGGPLH